MPRKIRTVRGVVLWRFITPLRNQIVKRTTFVVSILEEVTFIYKSGHSCNTQVGSRNFKKTKSGKNDGQTKKTTEASQLPTSLMLWCDGRKQCVAY